MFMTDAANLVDVSDFLATVNLVTGFQEIYYVVLILPRCSAINSRTCIYLCSITEKNLLHWFCISMKMTFNSFMFVTVKL